MPAVQQLGGSSATIRSPLNPQPQPAALSWLDGHGSTGMRALWESRTLCCQIKSWPQMDLRQLSHPVYFDAARAIRPGSWSRRPRLVCRRGVEQHISALWNAEQLAPKPQTPYQKKVLSYLSEWFIRWINRFELFKIKLDLTKSNLIKSDVIFLITFDPILIKNLTLAEMLHSLPGNNEDHPPYLDWGFLACLIDWWRSQVDWNLVSLFFTFLSLFLILLPCPHAMFHHVIFLSRTPSLLRSFTPSACFACLFTLSSFVCHPQGLLTGPAVSSVMSHAVLDTLIQDCSFHL